MTHGHRTHITHIHWARAGVKNREWNRAGRWNDIAWNEENRQMNVCRVFRSNWKKKKSIGWAEHMTSGILTRIHRNVCHVHRIPGMAIPGINFCTNIPNCTRFFFLVTLFDSLRIRIRYKPEKFFSREWETERERRGKEEKRSVGKMKFDLLKLWFYLRMVRFSNHCRTTNTNRGKHAHATMHIAHRWKIQNYE